MLNSKMNKSIDILDILNNGSASSLIYFNFQKQKIMSGKKIAYTANSGEFLIEVIGDNEQISLIKNTDDNKNQSSITDKLNIMKSSVFEIQLLHNYLPEFIIQELHNIEQVNIVFNSGSKLIYANSAAYPNVLENKLIDNFGLRSRHFMES